MTISNERKAKTNEFVLFSLQITLSLHAKIRKMAETFLLGMLIIAISLILLCIKLILLKNGKFSSPHVGDNPGLRKNKIHCVLDEDKEARRHGERLDKNKSV